MKHSRSILSVLLVLILFLLLLLFLPHIRSQKETEIFAPRMQTKENTSDSAGILHVRGDWTYPPFEYINEQGRPDGFNIEIIRRIAALMNLDIEISLGPWDTVRKQLERGEIDILAGMYKTAERDLLLDFTIPHFISSYGVFVRKDSNIDSLEKIHDKRILVQEKDVGHDYLATEEIGAEIITVDSWDKLLPALESGRGDCAVLSMMQGVQEIQEQHISNVRVITDPLFQQRYCIAVKSGDAELLATLNEGLNLLKSSGEYDEIFERWFGVYSDPSFSNQSLLMSPEVRLFIGIFLLLAVLLLVFLAWTYLLHRQVNRKTAELSSVLENLKRANTTKNRFLASVSHELRTPLHGIIGMVRLLRKTNLDNEQREMLEMLGSSSIQLHRVLSDLIDVTRLETGRFSFYPSEFRLGKIGTWLEPVLRRSAEDKGLSFHFNINNENTVLYADQERLVQIVLNLAQNAIKNTSEGSVDVHIEYSNSRLHIRVQDTGRGIPQEQREAVFTPFTQLEDHTQRLSDKESGLGLGLSIVKTITDLLHGSIEIKSNSESGTTFIVSLPLERGTLPSDEKNESEFESSPVSGERKLRILVAEDEAINRIYLERLLHERGWKTTPAADGREVWDLLQKESFDVVLMDLGMPELGGVEVTKLLREYERKHDYPRTKVIALTAYADEDNRRKCSEAGMDGFVTKPFKERELIDEMQRVVFI